MKFGLLHGVEVLRPWDEHSQRNVFWEAIEQIRVAEEAGFEYAWSVEHHFMDEFSLPSARGVARCRPATHVDHSHRCVVLRPFGYNHPVRIAERAATLVSNGRLELPRAGRRHPRTCSIRCAASAP